MPPLDLSRMELSTWVSGASLNQESQGKLGPPGSGSHCVGFSGRSALVLHDDKKVFTASVDE